MITRRGLFGFLAAPAIVRIASIMPVKVLPAELLTFSPSSPDYLAMPTNDAVKLWSRQLAREMLRKTYIRNFYAGEQWDA